MRTLHAHSEGNGKDIKIAVGTSEENRDSIIKFLYETMERMPEAKKINNAKKATLPSKVAELVEFDKKVIRPTLIEEMGAVYMANFGQLRDEEQLVFKGTVPEKGKTKQATEASSSSSKLAVKESSEVTAKGAIKAKIKRKLATTDSEEDLPLYPLFTKSR